MYYNMDLLSLAKKGKFSKCWFVATMRSSGKDLSKNEYQSVHVTNLCGQIEKYALSNSNQVSKRTSLYLTAQLSFGTTRILEKQVDYLQDDLAHLRIELVECTVKGTGSRANTPERRRKRKTVGSRHIQITQNEVPEPQETGVDVQLPELTDEQRNSLLKKPTQDPQIIEKITLREIAEPSRELIHTDLDFGAEENLEFLLDNALNVEEIGISTNEQQISKVVENNVVSINTPDEPENGIGYAHQVNSQVITSTPLQPAPTQTTQNITNGAQDIVLNNLNTLDINSPRRGVKRKRIGKRLPFLDLDLLLNSEEQIARCKDIYVETVELSSVQISEQAILKLVPASKLLQMPAHQGLTNVLIQQFNFNTLCEDRLQISEDAEKIRQNKISLEDALKNQTIFRLGEITLSTLNKHISEISGLSKSDVSAQPDNNTNEQQLQINTEDQLNLIQEPLYEPVDQPKEPSAIKENENTTTQDKSNKDKAQNITCQECIDETLDQVEITNLQEQETFTSQTSTRHEQEMKEFLGRLTEYWNNGVDIDFDSLCPVKTTSRRIAARMFAFLLELRKQQKVILLQKPGSLEIDKIRKN